MNICRGHNVLKLDKKLKSWATCDKMFEKWRHAVMILNIYATCLRVF